jgi:hypothetical protein
MDGLLAHEFRVERVFHIAASVIGALSFGWFVPTKAKRYVDRFATTRGVGAVCFLLLLFRHALVTYSIIRQRNTTST